MTDFGLDNKVANDQALTEALLWHGFADPFTEEELQRLLNPTNTARVERNSCATYVYLTDEKGHPVASVKVEYPS